MNPLETRMRSANPIPDPRSDFDDGEVAALLNLIRARSTDMDMQELTRPVEPEPKPKPTWWIAAAAFAAVIVIVGAAVLLTRPTSDVAPATETPTTEAQSLPTTTVAAASEDAGDAATDTGVCGSETFSWLIRRPPLSMLRAET